MELFAFVVHWLYSVAGLLIVGTSLICLMSLGSPPRAFATTHYRLLKSTLILTFVLVISGFFLPSLQAVSISGTPADALNQELLTLVLFSTRFGTVWAVQESLSLLLLISLLFHRRFFLTFSHRHFFVWIITLASLTLAVGSFKGHAAGLEPVWPGLLAHSLHLIAAACWLGALPALGFVIYSSTGKQKEAINTYRLLNRFSLLASLMVAVILLSGVVIGYLQIDRWAELFATPYGHYLLVKVFLFILMLCVASIIRFRCKPKNTRNSSYSAVNKAISKWIAIETTIGLVLLGFANVLKNTTPASHEASIIWPFNFRFSLDATWNETASVQSQVLLGMLIIILAMTLAVYLFRVKHAKKYAVIVGTLLSFAGIATALQPLSVTAYPDTYRNSSVPYDAITINNGRQLYSENCAACHGSEGKGDGILADDLDTMMMDLNLMHSAESTTGDMYWSFNQELFKDTFHSPIRPFNEDETWELINYLSAMASSYTGRSLYTYIDPNNPILGAPDFYYSTDNTSGNLKDFRQHKAVLLVLFSWPQDKPRLDKLKQHYNNIKANNTEVIAVEISSKNNDSKGARPSYPFIVVTEQTEAIINTYSLFRRSFINQHDIDAPHSASHIEFIIDRFGYLRARWIPKRSTSTWNDLKLLKSELAKLANEPEILPPPDEHAH
ncbi:MAG: hypothetical protein COB89_01840 [Piscirickettsiaceae bacterium]|nr:MAG: hypothetical protein COB89_06930 [Piscirickettsiaceae bacterium]PCH85587.1 MAG: hypothetical protein COB89_01840 [Piscirickettsiaceae bacterium]